MLCLQVADHFNAEVVAGTITSKQDAVDYLTWTFFFRRLLQNPAYYDMEGTDAADVNAYLSGLVNKTLFALEVHCWLLSCLSFGRKCILRAMFDHLQTATERFHAI